MPWKRDDAWLALRADIGRRNMRTVLLSILVLIPYLMDASAAHAQAATKLALSPEGNHLLWRRRPGEPRPTPQAGPSAVATL